jgi:phage gpG-like protein
VQLTIEMADWDGSANSLIAKAIAVEAATKTGLGLVAHQAEAAAKRELARRGHQRGTPTPALAGEPPARVSGALLRSVQVQGPTGGAGTYEASVGPTMVYARIQELGGTAGRGHRARLPARPYMHPALVAVKKDILAIMVAAWRRALGV